MNTTKEHMEDHKKTIIKHILSENGIEYDNETTLLSLDDLLAVVDKVVGKRCYARNQEVYNCPGYLCTKKIYGRLVTAVGVKRLCSPACRKRTVKRSFLQHAHLNENEFNEIKDSVEKFNYKEIARLMAQKIKSSINQGHGMIDLLNKKANTTNIQSVLHAYDFCSRKGKIYGEKLTLGMFLKFCKAYDLQINLINLKE